MLSFRAKTSLLFVIPIFLASLIFSWGFYVALENIFTDKLKTHGQLVASYIANISEYPLISGNLLDLDVSIRNLIKSDATVQKVEVLDLDKTVLLAISKGLQSEHPAISESRIQQLKETTNLFDSETLHLNLEGKPPSPSTKTLGYIRVFVSSKDYQIERNLQIKSGIILISIVLLFAIFFGLLLASSLVSPLKAMVTEVRKIRDGNYSINLLLSSTPEFNELQTVILEMAKYLVVHRANLESIVAERTKKLQEARDDAILLNAENRRLIKKINEVAEEERKTLANELHDQLNASLIAIRLHAQMLLDLIVKTPLDKNRAIGTVTLIISSISELYELSRNLIRKLRPEIIEMLGVAKALEDMVTRYDELLPGKFCFECLGDTSRVSGVLAITVYRIVQEALSNIIKHAQATTTSVSLKIHPKHIELCIQDNGVGFGELDKQGMGLIGMRERVIAANGGIHITSSQNGTSIAIELPIQ